MRIMLHPYTIIGILLRIFLVYWITAAGVQYKTHPQIVPLGHTFDSNVQLPAAEIESHFSEASMPWKNTFVLSANTRGEAHFVSGLALQ
jgi:hypothetical protein